MFPETQEQLKSTFAKYFSIGSLSVSWEEETAQRIYIMGAKMEVSNLWGDYVDF